MPRDAFNTIIFDNHIAFIYNIILHFPTVEPIQDQSRSGPNKSKAWNISMQSKQHTGVFLVGIKQCGQLS